MKTYILLRSNTEYGPYTLMQLKSFGLAENDLIWIEGESTTWEHPTGISGLKAIAKGGIKSPLPEDSQHNKKIEKEAVPSFENTLDEDYLATIEKESQPTHFYKRPTAIRTSVSQFFGLAVLLIGVMLCAFVVKKMVDGFGVENDSISEAKEISSETLALSASSSNTANETASAATAQLGVENIILKKDSVQKQIAEKKPIRNESKNAIAIADPIDTASAITETDVVKKEVTEVVNKPEEKPVPVPAVVRTSLLQISSNDYKVGMFGGVSDLELSVSNASSIAVDKATVEVEFLKPNGSVVKSQTLVVENISPGASKKVMVPSSNRGVKVRFRVVNASGKQLSTSENNS